MPQGSRPTILPIEFPGKGSEVAVLLIEDDRAIQRSLSFHLRRQGYAVTCCDNGEEGLEQGLGGKFQVVILDIMLPRLDGLTACRRLRAVYADLPIIITSARGSDADKITGLEVGADDYLAKPFSALELEARIRAVRRRAIAQQRAIPSSVTHGDITLDRERHEVCVGDRKVHLTRREFEIFSVLMHAPGRVFSREALLAHLWGQAYDGYNRTIDSHLARMRRRLRRDGSLGQCIEAVYGIGYRFTPPPKGSVASAQPWSTPRGAGAVET